MNKLARKLGRNIAKDAAARMTASEAIHAAEQAAQAAHAPPEPPKQLQIIIPVNLEEEGFGASRVVNGAFKRSFNAKTLLGVLKAGFGPYLQDDWPEDTSITFTMQITRDKTEEDKFDEFLGRAARRDGNQEDEETEDSGDDTGTSKDGN